jgi:hypothetical protein
VNLRPHSGHWRRRRMAEPSSAMRLSTTRESGLRQNGQYMASLLRLRGSVMLQLQYEVAG